MYSLHSRVQVPRRIIFVTFKLPARTLLISLSHGKYHPTTHLQSIPANTSTWGLSTNLFTLPRCTSKKVRQLTMAAPSHIPAPLKHFTSITIIPSITVESLSCGSSFQCTTTPPMAAPLQNICMWSLVSIGMDSETLLVYNYVATSSKGQLV